MVGAPRGAAEGRAQRAADHDRRLAASARRAPSAASSRRRRWTASPQDGLRYTNFHSTSLCSPTRAALITGRNHHVGRASASWARSPTGYPGYDSIIRKDNGTIGTILKENGYATVLVRQGPQHAVLPGDARPGRSTSGRTAWASSISMASSAATRASGSRTSSATRRRSIPFQGNARLEPDDRDGRRGHPVHEAAQGDRAREAVPSSTTCPGGTHAPHHPTPEWVKKISDMHLFDDGWNKLRDTIFANQKRLGIMPEDAKLTAWPEGPAEVGQPGLGREEAVHQAGRRLRRLSRLHRPRDRPRRSRPSRIWASSTTR